MNKRCLKKQIHALSADMILETSFISALAKDVNDDDVRTVVEQIYKDEKLLASKVNKKVAKRGDKAVKVYYRNLIKDWNKTIAESYKKMNALSGK